MKNKFGVNLSVNSYISNHKDFSVVKKPARIAVYDDIKAAPRIIKIDPGPTSKFIEDLTNNIYQTVTQQNGTIPYTTIREITENFIHADFSEIVVSVLDHGNTIRFADQGPGFSNIENAILPGFTSATESMKQYIRGVGSGLPTVNDYIQYSNGTLKIENNLSNGAVVTISMIKNLKNSVAFSASDKQNSDDSYNSKLKIAGSELKTRQRNILLLLLKEGNLGVTEIKNKTNSPISTIHKDFTFLEDQNLITSTNNKKRELTDLGFSVAKILEN